MGANYPPKTSDATMTPITILMRDYPLTIKDFTSVTSRFLTWVFGSQIHYVRASYSLNPKPGIQTHGYMP